MIRAILIDDEPLARSIVREYLQAFPQIAVEEECMDGFEGIKAIQRLKPDLVFLDIQMPKINGFEMLELVEELPKVIFTTAFDEYAMKAFEINAVDYLLKPFSKERFDKAIQKVIDMPAAPSPQLVEEGNNVYLQQSQRIVIRDQGKIIIIPLVDILYFEADDDYVKIHTKDKIYLKNKTLAYYEKALEGTSFLRVHRSFLVNTLSIARIDPYGKENFTAQLSNGNVISVSKSGYSKLTKGI
jgi:two-component system, LytTR family, response regulator